MKCPACDAQWQPGKSISVLATCPFCGASLAKKKDSERTGTIENILCSLIQEYGADLYKKENSNKLKSLLDDFAVKFPKERKLLGLVLNEGIQEKLLNGYNGDEYEKNAAVIFCKNHLTENLSMTEDGAEKAVSILMAGLDEDFQNNAPPTKPKPSSEQNASPVFASHHTEADVAPATEQKKSTETNESSKKSWELTVASDGSGDCTNIQAAIDASPAGTVIRIKPGVYKGSVTLNKPLSINGVEGSISTLGFKALPVILLEMTGHFTVTEQAAGSKISGVVFTQFAEDFENLDEYSKKRDNFDSTKTKTFRVQAIKGWSSLSKEHRSDTCLAHISGDVEFTETAFLCPLEDIGEIAAGKPSFNRCYFGHGYIFADEYDKQKARRWTGFHIKNNASPVMQNCTFSGLRITFSDKSSGTFSDCDISKSGKTGILVTGNANPTLKNCKIHNCNQQGIMINEEAGGIYENCEIYDNKTNGKNHSGVWVGGLATPVFKGCTIYAHLGSGIWIKETACGTCENCEIYGNKGYGIIVTDSASPDVRNCSIYKNSKDGLCIMGNAGGTYENCKIYDNTDKNVNNTSVGNPSIRNC